MAFRKLFNTLKDYFRSKPQVPEQCNFIIWNWEDILPAYPITGVKVGQLRYQLSPVEDTVIVHADFSGEHLKSVFSDPYKADQLYRQYFEELQRLKSLGFKKLMAIVPAGRKSGLSMLLEQGGFVKDQEVFILDIGGQDGV